MKPQADRILALVAFIGFVDALGVGLILPVAPDLVVSVAHVRVEDAAPIGGLLAFIYALMQFLFAPVIAGISDRFGRRPVLLLTLFALGLDYVLMAWAPSLFWLVLGRVISGIMGATWSTTNSCVADCLPPERRGGAFGLLAGASGLGIVLGPALGGFAGEFGTRIPFMIAACLALSGAAIGYVVLRETLPLDQRRAFDWRRANPIGSLIETSRQAFLLGSLGVIFLTQLAAQAQLSIWAYYGTQKFGWTPLISGLTVSFYGILIVMVQVGVTGKAIAKWGPSRVAKYAILVGLPCYLALAFANSTPMIIAAILIGCPAAMMFPALQSLMSARVSADAQGELQGALASSISLTSIIGPLIMTNIFSFYSDRSGTYFPGAPFVVSAGLLSLAILLLWATLNRAARVTAAANAGQSLQVNGHDRRDCM